VKNVAVSHGGAYVRATKNRDFAPVRSTAQTAANPGGRRGKTSYLCGEGEFDSTSAGFPEEFQSDA